MTTYYSLNVTNKCNKACPYCVNIDYVNKKEYPDIMKFGDLRNWLEKEINEGDIVETAGTGEPTLCEWLPELLLYLSQKKAWAILKTNGAGLGRWRLSLENLVVVLARHDSSDEYVASKCEYLLPNDIILMAITKEAMLSKNDRYIKVDDFFQGKWHGIGRAFCVSPDGKVRFMPCVAHDMGTVWDYKPEGWDCITLSQCPFLVNAWNFIEYLKNPFDLPDGCGHLQVKNFQMGV